MRSASCWPSCSRCPMPASPTTTLSSTPSGARLSGPSIRRRDGQRLAVAPLVVRPGVVLLRSPRDLAASSVQHDHAGRNRRPFKRLSGRHPHRRRGQPLGPPTACRLATTSMATRRFSADPPTLAPGSRQASPVSAARSRALTGRSCGGSGPSTRAPNPLRAARPARPTQFRRQSGGTSTATFQTAQSTLESLARSIVSAGNETTARQPIRDTAVNSTIYAKTESRHAVAVLPPDFTARQTLTRGSTWRWHCSPAWPRWEPSSLHCPRLPR